MLIASQVFIWLMLLLLSVAVLALARQVGVLHERIAPVGALAIGKGPQPGDAAPVVRTRALDGSPVVIGGPREKGRLRLYFFVAPSCPVCKQLMPTARRFARSEHVDLLFIGDGDVEANRLMAERHEIPPDQLAISPEAAMAFHVGKLPYAALVAPEGTLISQGLVNTREHLESLLSVAETGFVSIQDYLSARAHRTHAGEEANA